MKMPHEYRRIIEHKCAVCGTLFMARSDSRWKDRYCSNKCKMKAKYERKKKREKVNRIKLLRSG